ncbi:Hypothetical predicted protein, partial [Prunus dulcis]
NITIHGLTILAPIDSPNTDGINPDSCSQTRIEDCFIVSGDDCIAVKSGWDQYGIKVGIPTEHLVIRRLTCISPDSATIALGSEMSGGIRDVRAEDITALSTQSSVRIKTAQGRGGYVKDIFVRRMTLKTMKYVFWMTGSYGSHPDPGFDPKALPLIQNINYKQVEAENVTYSARLEGIPNDPFKGICISNLSGAIFFILGLFFLRAAECRTPANWGTVKYSALSCRKHSALLTDFGAVGDGKTSNTKAFKAAIHHLSQSASDGGAQLIVPPGKWLTGSFNLTSHFTLFLHKDAVILATQDESEWPLVSVLPSYGRGRDAPGGRFSSLIFGTNLTDVVITGNNGTIDGQGASWWKKFKAGQLNETRPYMIEIMYSNQIQISNLTLVNSPSWFVHPIYS